MMRSEYRLRWKTAAGSIPVTVLFSLANAALAGAEALGTYPVDPTTCSIQLEGNHRRASPFWFTVRLSAGS